MAYELVFAPDGSGEDSVIVHPIGGTGPGGQPVYTDDSGIIRAEISDRGGACPACGRRYGAALSSSVDGCTFRWGDQA